MPTLPNNSVVVMDNATVHQGQNRVNAFGLEDARAYRFTFPPILQI
jgi:hypothetical protein